MSHTESALLSTLAGSDPVGLARRWLRRAGADRGAVLGLLSRAWLLATAPVTLVLIARNLTPETQGVYYTFSSLIALQAFVELGFYLVILNIASHEWASLRLGEDGRIAGNAAALSRLVSLGRLIFKWYAVASAIFVAAVSVAGYLFFSGMPDVGVDWRAPWFALVALSGLLLWALPFNSLLEGCGQVAEVYRFRLSQAVLGNLALWLTLALGGGLWASVVWAGVSLSRDVYLLLVRYGRFFEPFFRPPAGPQVHWRTEIWPMQWRLALGGVVNYLAFSLFNPVMFRYHGAAEAGRMGMTLSAVFGIQSVAVVWVQAKAPRFGALVALREFDVLDRLFYRVTVTALLLLSSGGCVLWWLIAWLYYFGHPLSGRLLAPLPAGLFLAGAAVHLVSACESVYLRAHKQEPTAVLSVVSSVAIGLLVWCFGGRFGPVGAASAYAGVYLLSLVCQTVIWHDCRASWHNHAVR
jgi:O-antigen/teichoic acid export membrane protein